MTFRQTITDLFDPTSLTGALTYALILMILAMAGARLVRVIAVHSKTHLSDHMALNFVTQFLRLFVFVVAFIVYCHLIPSLRALGTTLLAGAGVVSIIIGLAAQNALGNLIAGFSLVLYRPFRVGDEVQINLSTGTLSGTVHALSLGYTVLRDAAGKRIVVPNSLMSSTALVLTEPRPKQ
jgi:small-conductance mechanosensitive channel